MEFDQLPGFRFHPTEEELLDFYLKETVLGQSRNDIIGFLNIYNHEPWDLPGLAKIGEREWYFFVHRESKNGHGGKPNRTTETGYWKATGSDRPIRSLINPKRLLGHRKTMVFYRGRAPRGSKTDWVMNEYRLPSNFYLPKEIVLCKVYRKATPLKVLEQRAAVEETVRVTSSCPQIQENFTFYDQQKSFSEFLLQQNNVVHKVEGVAATEEEEDSTMDSLSQIVGVGPIKDIFSELQLPKFILDWTIDPSWV